MRLADIAAEPEEPRSEPAQVVRAWLDGTVKPVADLRWHATGIRCFWLPTFVPGYRGLPRVPMCDRQAAECVESLNALAAAMPSDQWLLVSELHSYMLYNDLGLPLPGACREAYFLQKNKWGNERCWISSSPMDRWERPIVHAFLEVLTAVGALDAVIVPCDTERGWTLHAVRLTAVGRWYFQDGPESCFTPQETGRVILDQRRLFIRLDGQNPVLKVALEQVAHPLGEGLYRVDAASLLADCNKELDMLQKVDTLKSLLPDELPAIWEQFFANLLERVNPLVPTTAHAVLEVSESSDFRQLLLQDPKLRGLVAMAEGGRVLVSAKDMSKFKKRLRDLGYFIDSF